MKPKTVLFLARRAARSYGVRGALVWAGHKAWSRIIFAESHIWYELDPTAERPQRTLQSGLTLRRGGAADVWLLTDLETVTPDQAVTRIDQGNEHWLVLDGDQLLFSCWIFRARTPALAAPGGQLRLADDMVCVEDSVTAAAARGRGVAPAAWSAIADRLAGEGQRRMITKVTVENIASRKAVEKAGFEAVAVMHFKRIGPLSRTSVKALEAGRGSFFVETLDPKANSDSQARVNKEAWETGGHVADYANRRLLPVEVLLLVRHREALAGRVLEVGCGAGRILGYLVALGGEVHGIDISSAMVDHCRVAYPKANVRVGDLAALRASVDGSFAAVLAMDNVLDVVDDAERRRVLSEIRELIEPDGILIFSSHNLDYSAGAVGTAAPRSEHLRRLLWKAAARPVSEVVRAVAQMPRRIANRRRLAPLQRRYADHAIINDEAHDYGLLHYYIRRDDQARQLAEQGYELIECLDVEGGEVHAGRCSPAPWLHYVARPAR
jgi:SAM-dependent methyltransferase